MENKMIATKKQKGLGRGLDALLAGNWEEPIEESKDKVEKVANLALTQIQAGKYQPRTRMDEEALNELAASIREQGLMQPILVRTIGIEKGDAKYEIIAGERRFRAAQLVGLSTVPVLIKEVDDQAAAAMALIENMQREDLNPLEEAQGINRLISEFDFTHEKAAQAVGRSRSAVSNLLRLLNLAKPIQIMLMAGDIDMGHARALLVVDGATQIVLANQVIAKRLSVRETEKLVQQTLLGQTKEQKISEIKKEKSRDVLRLEEELADILAMPVNINVNKKNQGQFIIEFANLDALDALISRLRVA